jgi:hypothetical protein
MSVITCRQQHVDQIARHCDGRVDVQEIQDLGIETAELINELREHDIDIASTTDQVHRAFARASICRFMSPVTTPLLFCAVFLSR